MLLLVLQHLFISLTVRFRDFLVVSSSIGNSYSVTWKWTWRESRKENKTYFFYHPIVFSQSAVWAFSCIVMMISDQNNNHTFFQHLSCNSPLWRREWRRLTAILYSKVQETNNTVKAISDFFVLLPKKAERSSAKHTATTTSHHFCPKTWGYESQSGDDDHDDHEYDDEVVVFVAVRGNFFLYRFVVVVMCYIVSLIDMFRTSFYTPFCVQME